MYGFIKVSFVKIKLNEKREHELAYRHRKDMAWMFKHPSHAGEMLLEIDFIDLCNQVIGGFIHVEPSVAGSLIQ